MANIDPMPDPYQGWYVIWPQIGNVTAHQIMTDTSNSWRIVSEVGGIRTYQQH